MQYFPPWTTSDRQLQLPRRHLLVFLLASASGLAPLPSLAISYPAPVMLAKVYRPGIPLAQYWVSEKMDGVRGYWDGQRLLTRHGEPIYAPAWFTAGWPKLALDGELWAGREQFATAVSTVRQQTPDDAAWRTMRFMVFDLPAHGGTFDQRIPALQEVLADLALPWVQPVRQFKVANQQALQAQLDDIVKQGGEGLVLHRGDSLYRGERNDDLLKFKPYEDAEARVVAHLPGNGRYQGQVGALLVETADGKRFRLGSGLNDQQRQQAPAVGTWVTYRFRGVNPSGLPRFATFMRIREDMPPAR
ncbi:DNA ligase [Undibacterium arcticum]|uniref:DNA ligase n=1 Tax=Undibacterium arcticum TaxID=1762892 RepID=A0ABV7F7P3_9BURK